jgi:hypothetical protein
MSKRKWNKKRPALVVPSMRSPCPKCGVRESHFVPPSLGERGFFICEKAST